MTENITIRAQHLNVTEIALFKDSIPEWMKETLRLNPVQHQSWSAGDDYMGKGDGFFPNREPAFYTLWEHFRNEWPKDEVPGAFATIHAFYFTIATVLDFTEEVVVEAPVLELNLWMLQPNIGSSRGILIEYLDKNDFLLAIEMLQKACQRNAELFDNLPIIAPTPEKQTLPVPTPLD